jgi:AcrR family transcriptional regulator
MPKRTAASIRARVRAEMIDAIKDAARRQLATEGANLSLRAIARELGMVSSALYRYFASRDELLTALIIDAYNAIGEVGERADGTIAERLNLTGRWLAVAHAWRDWALANPAEYALIHGSPVPGYAAPRDTVGPASRRFLVIAAMIRDGQESGALAPVDGPSPAAAGGPSPAAAGGPSPAAAGGLSPALAGGPRLVPAGGASPVSAGGPASAGGASPVSAGGPASAGGASPVSAGGPVAGGASPVSAGGPAIPAPLRAELNKVAVDLGVAADAGLTARALVAVTELFGALNFELFGQLNNTIDERRAWFDFQARAMAAFIGFR